MTSTSNLSLTSVTAAAPLRHRASRQTCGSLQVFAAVCLGCLVTGFSGCDFGASEPESPSTEESPAAASSIPLRIASTAPADFNERLQLAWNAVSEQPLEITSATTETLPDEAARTDVVLFPTSAMGDLQAADLLTPLAESYLESDRVNVGSFLPGLVNSSMKWGDDTYALSLGTALPAVWANADTETADSLTWSEYSGLIGKLPKGASAEPLAEGWAAVALLNRTATQTSATWLFERNTLEPLLETPPCVRALKQLVADRQRYPQELLTPEEVWSRLHAGELQVAIGWPANGGAAVGAVGRGAVGSGGAGAAVALRMLPYPTATEVFVDDWKPAESIPRPPLVSPRSWLVALAASCRQTAAARTFIAWLAGREGHATVRMASPDLAANRTAMLQSDASGLPLTPDSDPSRGNYDQYVMETLSDGQVRPTLRLPGADAYLAALDAQVVRALAGEVEPDEALAAAAEEWEAITERLGRQKQLRAWRQAQGLRGR